MYDQLQQYAILLTYRICFSSNNHSADFASQCLDKGDRKVTGKKAGRVNDYRGYKGVWFSLCVWKKSNDSTNVDYIPTYPYLRRLTLTSESAENYSRPVKKTSSNKRKQYTDW